MMRPIVCLLIGLLGGVYSVSGFAAEPPIGDVQKQTILFLTIEDDSADPEWDSRFAGELKLALDSSNVKTIRPDGRFRNQPIDKQVEQIRPLLKTHDASCAVWVTRSEESVILHVVVISKGRALVRLVEAPPDETSEPHLAAAARELTSTAHFFENSQSNWGIPILGTLRFGISDHIGPSTWIGGTVGLERRLAGGLFARGWVGMLGGPIGSSQGLEAKGFALQGGIGATYLWDAGRFSIGPTLGLQSEWSNVELKVGDGPETRTSEWQFQVITNLVMRFQLTERIGLLAGSGLLTTTHQEIYRQHSDDMVVYATPLVSFNTFLGIVVTPSAH